MKEDTTINKYKSIMILVPHQDDEILMTAGVIRHAVSAGIRVDIVMATNGDCGCSDYSVGRARLMESLAGIRLLGLNDENLHILGYADTGMPASESFLTHLFEEKDGEKLYPSLCSECTYGLPDKPEYHMLRHGSHAKYCRDSFVADLKEILLEKQPDCIFTTSEYDMHGDHSALFHFLCEALDELQGGQDGDLTGGRNGAKSGDSVVGIKEGMRGYRPDIYTGIVHSNAGDDHWPQKDSALFDCPQGFDEETGLVFEKRVRIPVPGEMTFRQGKDNLKYRALLQYETALEPGAYAFLMSFIKEEEIFWKV